MNTRLNIITEGTCRIPFFDLDEELEPAWPKLKLFIAQSSPSLYNVIKNLSYEEMLRLEPRKIRFTVWKYFNRAKYRATPFGSFASVSQFPISHKKFVPLKCRQVMDIYGWADWKDSSNKIDNHQDNLTKLQDNLTKLQFLSNSTWYRWDNEIRFLSIEDKKYTVNTIPNSTEVFLILDFCKSKRQYQEILDYIVTEQKLPREEITEILQDLLDVELLLTDNNRSLTEREVPKQLNLENTTETSKQYIISTRNITQGNLPFGTIKVLKEYIHFISSAYPKKINNNLIEFRNYFQQRWENQAVPLSLVFDPFSGFSYGAELADQDEEFIKITDIIVEPEKQNTHRISSFEKFIFRETMNGREIKLENYQEDRIDPRICLPNTLSALVHFYNGSPVVHSIGGSSANSLIGRFTILPVFEKYGRAIAKLEEESNPEIMFFDLAYICEGKVDNINRRSPLYQVELPFSNWSSFDQPLYLQDILVSIKNHTIILHHRPTGKRLIPRFASS